MFLISGFPRLGEFVKFPVSKPASAIFNPGPIP
jgi:hypothetical protein